MKNRPFYERLGFAWAGVRECWRTEPSFRSHVVLAAATLIAMLLLRPAPVWWALIGLVSSLVMAFELINSLLERLIDRLHPEIHPEIGHIKDMASASVLLIGLGALAVAVALVIDLLA
jgi:undecaprenol kinase